MKILSVIVLSSAALALVGCGKGGSSDPYNASPGADSSPNYNRNTATNSYQGGARDPARANTGTGLSTNYSGLGTNDQIQPIDPTRTNKVPEN